MQRSQLLSLPAQTFQEEQQTHTARYKKRRRVAYSRHTMPVKKAYIIKTNPGTGPMKKLYAILIVLVLSLSSCHVVRFFIWNVADIHDNKKFASLPVHASGEVFQFHQGPRIVQPDLPQNFSDKYGYQDINHFLKRKKQWLSLS